MAECAAAKGLGIYWSHHINRFECSDVGSFEVRYSQRKDLKVRERDKGIVIAVTGYPPQFRLAGFISAETAKKDYNATAPRSGPPAYFIPLEDLQPIELLLAQYGRVG